MIDEIVPTDEIACEYLGDGTLLWSWPGGISPRTSRHVLAVYRALHDDQELRRAGMQDVVPSYCAVALHFDPVGGDAAALRRRVEELLQTTASPASASEEQAAEQPPAVVRLPVAYNGEDLQRVAAHANLEPRRVIELHTEPEYTVAMIGFRPHFPYLIGMNQQLATPRLAAPRRLVPAGSVGIAGLQTGVYPVDSPGGWNLIGRTDPKRLIPLRPGDTVLFEEA